MVPAEASHLNHPWSALLVEELVRQGARAFFLSPGSRCTPLTLAVARHGGAVCHTHFDERGMAFHALGHARATARPAVLVCTSGTAAANYLPAVVEAAQAHVPLILLTADRPPELLDCGANQAIVQPGLYGGYTRWAADLPCPDEAVPPQALLSTVGHAVHRALGPPAGPVHLNCMFREPLSPTELARDFSGWLAPVRAWLDGEAPYTRHDHGQRLPGEDLAALAEMLASTCNGLLVAGELRTDAERGAVAALAAKLGWPAVPDVRSGLRLGWPGAPWVPHFDQALLVPAVAETLRPEVVLHVGGSLVSKRVQAYLETAGAEYIRVAGHSLRHDPGHLVRRRYACDVADACARLADRIPPCAEPARGLQDLDAAIGRTVDDWFDEQDGLSEITVARVVSALRPEGAPLFLGNSMPVRDMDMYGVTGGGGGGVHANRGASGIDGNIATAAGIARATAGPVLAVMGDLAALHDLNSLALLRDLDRPLVLVVVNNDGGGIFHFLPVAAQEDVFEARFATPHGADFAHAAAAFGVRHVRVDTAAALEAALAAGLAGTDPVLIEACTERVSNARLHRELQARVAALPYP